MVYKHGNSFQCVSRRMLHSNGLKSPGSFKVQAVVLGRGLKEGDPEPSSPGSLGRAFSGSLWGLAQTLTDPLTKKPASWDGPTAVLMALTLPWGQL